MKRIQYHRYGGPEEMRLEDFEVPPLRSGQISVRVRAASVNPIDWKVRNGGLKFVTGSRFPRGMGNDFSGIVGAMGPDVSRLKPGDEVFGTARFREAGSFADVLITNEKLAAVKPAALSFEQAACLPVAYVTAWRGLFDKAHMKAGQFVFVHGCLGAVGRAVVQLAKMNGARVAGSCSTASMEEARQLGVDPVLDYASDELLAMKNRFDIVYDTAGTLSMRDALSLLVPHGVFLDINPSPKKFFQGLLTRRYKLTSGNQTPETLAEIAAAATEGKLKAVIGKTVPLEEAIPAIMNLEKNRMPKGKVVIIVNPEKG